MENPVFYLQLYHDAALAEHALRHLRQSYPHARVILQSDGDDDPVYDALSQRFHCTYFPGKRLYTLENGGKMLQRMLNDYLAEEGDWLVKIDTDTRIDRPFHFFPQEDVITGSVLRQGPPQGDCVIIPRRTATRIRDSRILLEPALRNAKESWGKRMHESFLHERIEHTGCIGFEWTLFWACTQLNIPIRPHPEIYATWKQGNINADKYFAAVHPDKFLDVEDRTVHDLCTMSHCDLQTVWLDAIHYASI